MKADYTPQIKSKAHFKNKAHQCIKQQNSLGTCNFNMATEIHRELRNLVCFHSDSLDC